VFDLEFHLFKDLRLIWQSTLAMLAYKLEPLTIDSEASHLAFTALLYLTSSRKEERKRQFVIIVWKKHSDIYSCSSIWMLSLQLAIKASLSALETRTLRFILTSLDNRSLQTTRYQRICILYWQVNEPLPNHGNHAPAWNPPYLTIDEHKI